MRRDARVVLWGGREGDIQFGSPVDRLRERLRRGEMLAMAQLGRELMAAARTMGEVGRRVGLQLRTVVDALAEPERRRLNRQIKADLDYGRA